MSDATYILVVLIAYKVLLLGIGAWAQRRVKTTEDFFLGGRGLGPFVSALSYSASSSSAWKLLGFSGLAMAIGLSAVWIMCGTLLGHGAVLVLVGAPVLLRKPSAAPSHLY